MHTPKGKLTTHNIFKGVFFKAAFTNQTTKDDTETMISYEISIVQCSMKSRKLFLRNKNES